MTLTPLIRQISSAAIALAEQYDRLCADQMKEAIELGESINATLGWTKPIEEMSDLERLRELEKLGRS